MSKDNELILKHAKLLYNANLLNENTMGNSESKIFEVEVAGNIFILKASEYIPEKLEHTIFELKWMEYLSTHMVGIVKPQKSKNDNLYELIEINEKKYILFLLEKAQGKIVDVNNSNEFNETLFFNLGMLMGDMHRLTVKYDGNTIIQDFEWTGSVNFYRYDNPILDEEVRLYQQKYYDEINMLPKDRENYGIIHWDIHTDNFFVDNGNIKLFDFDACQFNWYAADIASAIFFMVLKGVGPMTHKSEKERTEFAETYIASYLKGYLQTNTISEYWIRKIDLFMKYQMCDEYLSAQHFWSGELLKYRDWYMQWHEEKIINDLPYVFVDYDKIINRIFKME